MPVAANQAGWDTQPAWFAATGMQALVVLLEEITEAEREALVRWGAKGGADVLTGDGWALVGAPASRLARSEEHTSELQSHHDLVCRLLLEKKKKLQELPQSKSRGRIRLA